MLKKHTKGEDTITYTLDQTAYDALGNTFGKAIKDIDINLKNSQALSIFQK